MIGRMADATPPITPPDPLPMALDGPETYIRVMHLPEGIYLAARRGFTPAGGAAKLTPTEAQRLAHELAKLAAVRIECERSAGD